MLTLICKGLREIHTEWLVLPMALLQRGFRLVRTGTRRRLVVCRHSTRLGLLGMHGINDSEYGFNNKLLSHTTMTKRTVWKMHAGACVSASAHF